MSKFLKGNYNLPEESEKLDQTDPSKPIEDPNLKTQKEFERRASERLGGSIAFIMKSSSFVWQPDAPKQPKSGDGSNKPDEPGQPG